jgi:hypothetical protein
LGIASPPAWAIDAGRHIMNGLLKGLAHGAGDVGAYFRRLASDIAGPLKAVWATIFGGAGTGGNVAGLMSGGLSAAEAWIIAHESGGSTTAANPHSSAFGLGQLLLGNRQRIGTILGFAPNTTDFLQQLAMFRYYYRERYGTAERAKAFWQAHGWYGAGLPPTVFTRPTLIGVGERGPEQVSVVPFGRGGRGGALAQVVNHYHVTVNGTVGSKTEVIAWVRQGMRDARRAEGKDAKTV